MYDRPSLSHSMWECNYHIEWIPKYRKKAIDGFYGDRVDGFFLRDDEGKFRGNFVVFHGFSLSGLRE